MVNGPNGLQSALDARVTSLSEGQAHLWEEVHNVRGSMATKDDMALVAAEVRGLSKQVAEATKPQWTTLIGFSGIVLTLIGGFWFAGIQPVKETLSRHEVNFDNVRIELNSRRNEFPSQFEYKEHVKHTDKFEDDFKIFRAYSLEYLMPLQQFMSWKESNKQLLDLLQKQIDDVNRQIAASILLPRLVPK